MKYVDASIQTIDGAHTVDDTTVDISDASEFEAPGVIKVWDQADPTVLKAVIYFTGISTNQLTGCVWDYGGHTDVNLASGDFVAQEVSAQDFPDAVVVDSFAAVSYASLTDVSIFSVNVDDIVAGDVILVEAWGFSNNGTGGNRAVVFTLDFDAAFDMEWGFTTVSTVQGWRLDAKCAVIATNSAILHIMGISGNQITAGAMTLLDTQSKQGYDATTSNLTGTTAVTLHARSDSASTTQEITVAGLVIRKLTAT